MLPDYYEGLNEVQLRTLLKLEQLKRTYFTNLNETQFSFGYPYVEVSNQRWYYSIKMQIPDDWYDRVYLEGIGVTEYHGKPTIILDAEEVSKEILTPENQSEHIKLYKGYVPIIDNADLRGKGEVRQRYIACAIVGDNEDKTHYVYIHKHPNAAAGNVRRHLMKNLYQTMGV